MRLKLLKAKRKSSILIFLFLSFFILNNNLFARELDIVAPKGVMVEEESDDFYDLDYDPTSLSGDNIEVWDPLEKMNRKFHGFNQGLLRYIAKPVYYNVYVKITTPGMRKSVSNVVRNLEMPIFFLNYVLQLDFDNAMRTLYSFGVNTTLGVFGVFDLAGHNGVSVSSTDLGVTFAKYYIPAGPYIVLPFFGPNDIRGGFGWIGEVLIDPFNTNIFEIGGEKSFLDDWVLYTIKGLYVIDTTSFVVANFYDLMESSFDSYIMMRDAYSQSQSYKINKVRRKIK